MDLSLSAFAGSLMNTSREVPDVSRSRRKEDAIRAWGAGVGKSNAGERGCCGVGAFAGPSPRAVGGRAGRDRVLKRR